MESLYLLIPLSVVIVFVAIWVFFKASDGGQFDDLVGPGMRILQDDDDRIAHPDPSAAPLVDKAVSGTDLPR
jgi:cbb3-type cytochrome oxidase maturation protein